MPAPCSVRGDDGGLFIALDSAERIELEPAPRLVATEVSRASLAPLGCRSRPRTRAIPSAPKCWWPPMAIRWRCA
jgi:hypothetical protein